MSQLFHFIKCYQLVWLRTALYAIVPAATLFLAKTDAMTPTEWYAMTPFETWKILIACGINVANTTMALLDQSLSRAREKHSDTSDESKPAIDSGSPNV